MKWLAFYFVDNLLKTLHDFQYNTPNIYAAQLTITSATLTLSDFDSVFIDSRSPHFTRNRARS